MKYWFLALLVGLMSAAAHALTGTSLPVDIPITITSGGGVACDFGPNTTLPTGTIGTDLTTAGMTHCALNADFTDNSGVAASNGWVMNNPATWLNQCSAPSPTRTWGKLWLMFEQGTDNINPDQAGPAPCNRAVMTTDAGSHVLEYTFSASDVGTSKAGIGLYWPLCGNSCVDLRPALPVPHYVEYTFRVIGVSQPNNGIMIPIEELLFDSGPTQPGGVFMDLPLLEAQSNNSVTTSSIGCGGPCGAGFRWNASDFGNYHTFAYLITSDGTANLATCFYRDGAGIPSTSIMNWTNNSTCGALPTFVPGFLYDHDQRFYLAIDSALVTGFTTATMVLKSIRVFICTNYTLPSGGVNGNNCTGTVVNHS